MLFRLNSCLTELLGVQTFRGELKLKFAVLSLQVEDTITRIVEDSILPGVGSVARHVEEDRRR